MQILMNVPILLRVPPLTALVSIPRAATYVTALMATTAIPTTLAIFVRIVVCNSNYIYVSFLQLFAIMVAGMAPVRLQTIAAVMLDGKEALANQVCFGSHSGYQFNIIQRIVMVV